MHHNKEESAKITFSDLSPAEGAKWTHDMPEHSTVSFHGKLTHAGYKDLPVSYMLCEEDRILPIAYQEALVERLEKETGRTVDVHRIKAAHCPNASQPAMVVEVVRRVAGEEI